MARRPASVELLRALAPILRRRRARWYVFGAQALIAHGRPRLTEDVDVTVEVAAAKLPPLIAALGRAGFTPRIPDAAAFAAHSRVIPFVHEPSSVGLDLVLAASGLELAFLERAALADLGGIRVPVIAADDLVITKVVAGRAKDLDDVAGVIAAQGASLDLRRIRAILGELDAALGDSSLLARFERLLAAR